MATKILIDTMLFIAANQSPETYPVNKPGFKPAKVQG